MLISSTHTLFRCFLHARQLAGVGDTGFGDPGLDKIKKICTRSPLSGEGALKRTLKFLNSKAECSEGKQGMSQVSLPSFSPKALQHTVVIFTGLCHFPSQMPSMPFAIPYSFWATYSFIYIVLCFSVLIAVWPSRSLLPVLPSFHLTAASSSLLG